jgi:hypothetical protein
VRSPGAEQAGSSEWSQDGQDPSGDGFGTEEPEVGVPAGLVAAAVELLDLCDEVFNRPGSDALDARLVAVVRRRRPADVATLRWFRDGLGVTALRLRELLDERGIIVDPHPAFAARPRHYR